MTEVRCPLIQPGGLIQRLLPTPLLTKRARRVEGKKKVKTVRDVSIIFFSLADDSLFFFVSAEVRKKFEVFGEQVRILTECL